MRDLVLLPVSSRPLFSPTPSFKAVLTNGLHVLAGLFLALLVFLAPGEAKAQSVDWTLNLSDTGFDPTVAGGTIVYDIEVTNNGFDPAPATTITLNIPPGTTFTGATGTITGCSPTPSAGPSSVECDIPALASNEIATLSAEVLTTTAGSVIFAASVPVAGDIDTNNNSQSETTTVTAGADIELQLLGPATAAAGSVISYTFTATNNGPDAATNVVLQFTIPTGIANVVPPPGCVLSGSVYSCSIPGPIAVGGSVDLIFQGQISAAADSTITAVGSVGGGTPPDPISANNDATFNTSVTAGSDLAITKTRSPSGSLLVGDAVTFSLVPSYTGDSPAAIVVRDTIPANYSITSVTAPGWTCTVSGQSVECLRPTGSGPGANVALGPITINTTAITAGSATNTGTISASGPFDPVTGNNSDSDGGATIADPIVDLEARKTGPVPALVVVGNPYTFQISTANIGNTSFIGTVRMTDTIPAGLSVTGYTLNGWTCTPGATPASPLVGAVDVVCERDYSFAAPLGAGQVTPVVAIQTTVNGTGPLLNSMTVTAPVTNLVDPNPPNNTVTYGVDSSPPGNAADIGIIKSAALASLPAGEVQTFTLEITNDGPQPATLVTVRDELANLINNTVGPTNAGFISVILSGAGPGDSCTTVESGGRSRTLTCSIAALPVCTTGVNCPVITIQVRPGGNAGNRTNDASVISNTVADPNLGNNDDDATFAIEARADVTVTKSDSADPIAAGQNLRYTITAQNESNGLSSAANVTITDILPADLTFVSAVPSTGSCGTSPAAGSVTGLGNNTLVCNLGTIGNGGQQTVQVTVRPNLVTSGTTLQNTASVTTTTVEINTGNNSDTEDTVVSNPLIDLLINKDDSNNTPEIGVTTVYAVTVSNLGPSAAENVVVTDTMPSQFLTYQSHTVPADGSCSAVPAVGSFSGLLTCTFPYLLEGEARTINITALGVAKGVGFNTAVVASDETALGFEPNTSNNSAEEQTTVRTRADVEVVSKTANPGTVNLRDPFNFVIVVRNNTGPGRAEADDVVVSDTLPAGMVLNGTPTVAVTAGNASATTCTGLAGATSFSCSLGTLSGGTSGVGGTVEITVPVIVTSITSNPRSLTNTATVETRGSLDEVPTNNSNSGSVTVNGSSISGSVFRDFADDGALDGSDTGIAGVTITLTGAAFDGTPITRTTTTAADGTYFFDFLPEGSYSIAQGSISEAHLTNGQTAAGSTGGTVSSPVVISTISLGPDESATGYVFPKIPQARVAIAKAVQSGPTLNPDGSFNVTFRLRVNNPSLEALSNMVVSDTLQGAAPAFGTYVSLASAATDPLASGSYTLLAAPSGSCGGLASGFNGAGSTDVATGFGLGAGASCTIDLQLRVQSPNPLPPALTGTGTYLNQAVVTAEGALSGQTSGTNPQLTDLSDNGTVPDSDGDGIGNEVGENDPTPVTPFQAAAGISLIKSLADVTDNDSDGLLELGDTATYTFTVRNTGNIVLVDVQIADPILTVQGGPITLAVGASDAATFTGSYVLTQADIDRGYVENSATATGDAVTSTGDPVLDASNNPVTASDVSDSGTNPDAAGSPVPSPETTETADGTGATDGDLTNDPTVAILAPRASVVLVKSLVSVADMTGDGLIGAGDTATYGFSVTNTGNLALANVTVDDPLVAVSGGPISLAIGATNAGAFTASYILTQADVDRGYVENSATTTGGAVTLGGAPILNSAGDQILATDISDTGTNPDADGSPVANPAGTETPDGAGNTDADPTNDPTVALLSQTADILLVKRLTGTTDVNANGFVDEGDIANYAFSVTNTGNVGLTGVTITDSIAAVVGGPVSLAAGATNSGTFTASYTVTADDLLRGYVENTATATGNAVTESGAPLLDAGGNPIVVTDISDTGTNPDGSTITDPETVESPDGDGTTDSDPTNDPTILPVGNPEISLDIEIADIADVNGNGIIDAGDIISYTFTVTNTGGVPLTGVNMVTASLSLPLGLVCTPINLAVGETQTLVCTGNTYTITPTDVDVGTVSLSGTVNGTSVSGQVVADDDAVISPAFLQGGLNLTKTADRSQVNQGDIVSYTVTITNDSTTLTTTTNIVDVLPRGFIYQLGTAVLDGVATEPTVSGRTLTWPGVTLAPGASAEVVFDVLVGGSVRPGNHDNVARAVSPVNGRPVSEDAIATVRVAAEPVFSCSTVIGRVFDDPNQDGYFNDEPPEDRAAITDQTYDAGKYAVGPDAEGEEGLPGVRLITPDGLAITTDAYGRFSVPCAALPADIGSNFMLKLDTRTLPSGYRLTTENPRVVRLTAGMITKLNFGAAAAQVVRVDLSASAFGSDAAGLAPRAELVAALQTLVADIASTPAMLRISYQLQGGETDTLARQRMREVESILRRLWPSDGRYQLNIETVLRRKSDGEGDE